MPVKAKGEKMSLQQNSFFKIMRSEETRELLSNDHNSFVLLTQIAFRAKRTNNFSVHNLQPGQALIGDHESCGLTEQKYRSAKQRLENYGLATFRATNKGTIATLTDSRVFDINATHSNEQNNTRITDKQRTNNDYQECKNIKYKEGSATPPLEQISKRFQKPTPEQVTEYARSIGVVLDGRAFCDSYEAKGWLIGKSPMKNWEATVRNWKRREKMFPAPGGQSSEKPKQPAMSSAEIRAMVAGQGGAQ